MKRSNNSDIDRLFQSHFDMHEVPVEDKNALWRSIHPKRSRRILPFFIFLGLISAICVSFIVNQKNIKTPTLNESSIANNEIESEFAAIHSKQAKAVTGIKDKITDTPESLSQLETIEKELRDEEVNNQLKVNLLEDNQKKSSQDSGISSKETTDNQNIDEIASKHYDLPNPTVESKSFLESNSTEDLLHSLPVKSYVTNEAIIINPIYKGSISNLPIAKSEMDISSSFLKKDKNPLDDCIAGVGGHFYVDVYSLVGAPLEEVKLKSGFEDQTTYLSNWDEKYSTFPSVSVGTMIGYEFTSGLDIAVGAEYQKMESQYENTQTIIESITIYDPMAYFFYDDNNEVVWVGDSVTATSTYDRTVAVANSHNLAHIPLQVSYPLYRKGNWNLKANVAAALNLSFQYRGEFLRDDNSIVPVGAANHSTYFSPNVGLSFELGGHLGYRISPNWEAYLSPRFRYNQQSYLSDSQVISLSRNFANLRIGMQYHF